jgi:hypothetical protein
MSFADLQAGNGLLESLIEFDASGRASMQGFYESYARLSSTSPDTAVTPSDLVMSQASEKLKRLLSATGVASLKAVIPTMAADLGDPGFAIVSSDAAKEDAVIPGIGGYMHGKCWTLPLLPRHMILPITALEYVASWGSLVTFKDDMTSYWGISLGMDALVNVHVLSSDKSKSFTTVRAHLHMRNSDEFKAVQQRLFAHHIFGDGNFFADRASRGEFSDMSKLAAQMGIRLSWVEPHPDIYSLLDDLSEQSRQKGSDEVS